MEYQGRKTKVTNLTTGVWKETTVNAIGKTDWVSDPTGNINYNYDGAGRLVLVHALGAYTHIEYDPAGNQSKLTDPDAGTTTYKYNAFGELVRQTDARNIVNTWHYDGLGRITDKICNTTHELTSYHFNNTHGSNGFGMIEYIQSDNGGGTRYADTYDDIGRVITKTETVDGNQFTTTYEYGIINKKLAKLTFPSGFAVRYGYGLNGELATVTADATNKLLWEAVSENNLGQLTEYNLGNGLITEKEFDDFGYPEAIKTGNVQDLTYTFDQQTGNLLSRSDNRYRLTETFNYNDKLHARLTSWQVAGKPNYSVNYEDNGNIRLKTDVTVPGTPGGTYHYGYNAGVHAVTKIKMPTPEYLQHANDGQNVTYNMFNKIKSIEQDRKTLAGETVNRRLDFGYGPDELRKITRYSVNNVLQKTKYFIGPDYEIEKDAKGN